MHIHNIQVVLLTLKYLVEYLAELGPVYAPLIHYLSNTKPDCFYCLAKKRHNTVVPQS